MAFTPITAPSQGQGIGQTGPTPGFKPITAPSNSLNSSVRSNPAVKQSLVDHLKGIIGGVGDFMGGNKLGEGIGTSIYGIGQALHGNFKEAGAAADENGKNAPAIFGDALHAGASAATAAAGGAETIAGKAAQFGGLGAVSGGGESLAKGNDWKTAAVDAFKSGAIGAGLGAATGVAAKGLSNLAEKAPEAIYNNALKVLNRIKLAGKSPAADLVNEGIWGGLGTFKNAAEEGINKESSVIENKVAQTPGGTTYNTIKQKAIDKLSSSLGSLYSKPEIEQIIESTPIAKLRDAGENGLSWKEVDQVRSQLGNLIGDSKWLQANSPASTKAAKAVYGALADSIKESTDTQDEFARLSKWINTKKIVDRAVGIADGKYGLGLLDTVSGIGGAVTGAGQGNNLIDRAKNAAIGAGSAIATEKLLRSPATQTGIAQIIQHIGDLPTDSLGRVTKEAVVNLISKLTSSSPSSEANPQ